MVSTKTRCSLSLKLQAKHQRKGGSSYISSTNLLGARVALFRWEGRREEEVHRHLEGVTQRQLRLPLLAALCLLVLAARPPPGTARAPSFPVAARPSQCWHYPRHCLVEDVQHPPLDRAREVFEIPIVWCQVGSVTWAVWGGGGVLCRLCFSSHKQPDELLYVLHKRVWQTTFTWAGARRRDFCVDFCFSSHKSQQPDELFIVCMYSIKSMADDFYVRVQHRRMWRAPLPKYWWRWWRVGIIANITIVRGT